MTQKKMKKKMLDSTHIRYEDGKIVTFQHLLQLFTCSAFIHWK